MRFGEIVEILIEIKDNFPALSREEQAVTEACNVLDKMPRMKEARTYEQVKD